MRKRLWTSIPVEKATMVESDSNTLNVIVNDVEVAVEVEALGYETRIIQHESRLIEELNKLFEDSSINVVCKLGVVASGNVKSAHIVFEQEDTDVVSFSGSFSDKFLGEISEEDK